MGIGTELGALAIPQSGLGSVPGFDVMCRWSLLVLCSEGITCTRLLREFGYDQQEKKIGSLWVHVPSDMKNSIIRNDHMIQHQRVTDTSYSGFCWPKRRVGDTLTYYTSSKYYERTRMHDNIVPWALRALGTKMKHIYKNLHFCQFLL